MRFNCGETAEQKVYRLADEYAAELQRLENWHHKFAWLPVRLSDSNECAWLEWVQRKGERRWPTVKREIWIWEYAAIDDTFYR